MCPYVSANHIAAVTGRDVTKVSLEQEFLDQGGKGCWYDLRANASDTYLNEYVLFSYYRGIGEQGFEHESASEGEFVSGLGVNAFWGSDQLTVLTGHHDVVTIVISTDDANLSQAEQIFRLAAPKLRTAVWPGVPPPVMTMTDMLVYATGACIVQDLAMFSATVHVAVGDIMPSGTRLVVDGIPARRRSWQASPHGSEIVCIQSRPTGLPAQRTPAFFPVYFTGPSPSAEAP